jgi:hypothetical protein
VVSEDVRIAALLRGVCAALGLSCCCIKTHSLNALSLLTALILSDHSNKSIRKTRKKKVSAVNIEFNNIHHHEPQFIIDKA